MRTLKHFGLLAATFLGACGGETPPPPTVLEVEAVEATTGAPLAGVRVFISGYPMATTNAAGVVRLEVAAGRHHVRLESGAHLTWPRPPHGDVAVVVAAETTERRVVDLEPRVLAAEVGELSGTVQQDGAPVAGALVFAQSIRSFSTRTDLDGRWSITNVDADVYSVSAHLAGFASNVRANVEVRGAQAVSAVALLLTPATGTVGGNLVGGAGTTSVALALLSTREIIPGLATRAAIGSRYQITGVAPGTYAVVAGLETDAVTLDSEWVLRSGAPRAVVATASADVDLRFAPSVGGLSPREDTSAPARPTLSWARVEGADRYVLELRNVAGQVIWGGFDARNNPIESVLAPTTTLSYSGAPLARGRYRWRVFAARHVDTGALFELLAASEELDGAFLVEGDASPL